MEQYFAEIPELHHRDAVRFFNKETKIIYEFTVFHFRFLYSSTKQYVRSVKVFNVKILKIFSLLIIEIFDIGCLLLS